MHYLRLTGEATEDVSRIRTWLAVQSAPPVLIETSGSTGRPKRVVLTREAVLASAVATSMRIGSGRWWLTLPSSYVAGLMVVVRSLLAGTEPLQGQRRTGWVDADFVSLVPTQLHRMLEQGAALDRFKAVLVGGGPLDPALRSRAEQAGVSVIATYGSSETAGGVVYDGHALPGSRVRVGEDGRIALTGPTLFEKYDGDPALTAATLVDGWFLTSDLGELASGRLRVLGRVDDMVISGGVKVPGAAVAARLREHPDVEAAEVLGVPDPEWGQAVVACVVGPVSLDTARDWVSEAHPREWAPRSLVHLDAIPLLDNGKVDRERLRELAR